MAFGQLLPGPGGHQRDTRHAASGLRRLTVPWELALRADGYAVNSVRPTRTRCGAWPTGRPSTIPRSGRPTARRDTDIILLFLDGGLRLSELAVLQVADVELRNPDRVRGRQGEPAQRSPAPGGPTRGQGARALDRYLRERHRHPYADTLRLWLGSRGRPTLDADGVKVMLKRRSADGCITNLHPHAFRHTWAQAFRG